MKKAVVILLAVLLLSGTCWASEKERSAAKSKEVILTGSMTCTSCVLPSGQKCTKECCTNCLKSGDPVLFTDVEGHLYILLSSEKGQPVLSAERMNLISEKIRIKGTVVKKDGLKAIYVNHMEKI